MKHSGDIAVYLVKIFEISVHNIKGLIVQYRRLNCIVMVGFKYTEMRVKTMNIIVPCVKFIGRFLLIMRHITFRSFFSSSMAAEVKNSTALKNK